jgi:uncharacterized protein YjbJ (UPF0337 family)
LTGFERGTSGLQPSEEDGMTNRDQIEGEVKEQAGKLTDDESTEAEGKAQGAWGDVKEKAEEAKDKVEERM